MLLAFGRAPRLLHLKFQQVAFFVYGMAVLIGLAGFKVYRFLADGTDRKS